MSPDARFLLRRRRHRDGAADLSALRERVPILKNLTIERVRNEEDLAAWRGTLTRGFGEDPVEAEWISERYRDWAWATRGRSVTNSEGWAGSRWPPLHCSWA
jgi:hypothetical protein